MYKYQPWSSGNEDCFSWPTKTSTTNYYSKPWNNYYKIEDDKAWTYKGEDMTQIKIDIMSGSKIDYARAIKDSFSIDAPKFKVGDKIKFYTKDTAWKQGVVYTVSKQVNISSTQNEKNFKIDNVQWHYVIIESGNLKTWNGVKESAIKIDDTPDYNKYFDFLDKQGVKLDRTRYTWKSFKQEDWVTLASPFDWYGVSCHTKTQHKYLAILCDNKTNNNVEFKGTQVGNDKLPAISEKC